MPSFRELRIPVLCPCKVGLHTDIKRVLRSVLHPLGFEPTFRECRKIEEALECEPHTAGVYFDKIPYSVCMPIITSGGEIRDADGKHKPDPISAVKPKYSRSGKREVVLLVEDSVDLPIELHGSRRLRDARIIRFPSYTLEPALGKVVEQFVEIKKKLRSNLQTYQLLETRNSALNYDSVEKRVYVWPNGYGTVEMRFDISLDEAEGVRTGDDYFFNHSVSLRLAPKAQSKREFKRKLQKMRVKSIKDLLKQPQEALVALPFGLPAPTVDWRATSGGEDEGNKKNVLVQVTPAKNSTSDRRGLISYGIAWCSEDLFSVCNDATAFICAHNYRRIRYAVCFIRPTLRHDWPFKIGPMLERFGPCQNDIGFIDTNGVGDEGFHYLEYVWNEKKMPAGSVLRVRWKLTRPPHVQ
jgi:hypothetical protein